MTGQSKDLRHPVFDYDANGQNCLDSLQDTVSENNPGALCVSFPASILRATVSRSLSRIHWVEAMEVAVSPHLTPPPPLSLDDVVLLY